MQAEQTPPIYYGETDPRAAGEYVACYWHWRVRPDIQAFTHSIPPDGSVSLWFVHGVGFGVMGPQTQPLRIPSQGGNRCWGVRFWPGASGAVLPFDPGTLRNAMRVSSIAEIGAWLGPVRDTLMTDPPEEIAAQAWEDALTEPLARRPPLDSVVVDAVSTILRLAGSLSVGDLGPELGLSARQLRRRFRSATGLSPKELARVARIRTSLVDALFREEWAGLAAAHGFADQPHLIREYQRVLGDTPQRVLKRLQAIEHHAVKDRRR